MTVKHLLIDIEGVLVTDKSYRPVPGAVTWLNSLAAQGYDWRLVSNNTTHPPQALINSLRDAGFNVDLDQLEGAATTGCNWLRSEGHRTIGWLGASSLSPWLEEQGFVLAPPGAASCDAVVLGVNADLQVTDLDRAASWLQQGAALLCLHRNRIWLDATGLVRLGPGAWAAALEAAVPGVRSVTAGKPEPAVYQRALESLGALPESTLFISDDPFSDLAGARRLGMATVFVLSGKYPDAGILSTLGPDQQPDLVLDRADQLVPDRLQQG